MPNTHQIKLSLPHDIASFLQAKVKSGEYASENDAICDSLRQWFSHENDFESWLLKEVIPACEALEKDPSLAETPDQVRAYLATERA